MRGETVIGRAALAVSTIPASWNFWQELRGPKITMNLGKPRYRINEPGRGIKCEVPIVFGNKGGKVGMITRIHPEVRIEGKEGKRPIRIFEVKEGGVRRYYDDPNSLSIVIGQSEPRILWMEFSLPGQCHQYLLSVEAIVTESWRWKEKVKRGKWSLKLPL